MRRHLALLLLVTIVAVVIGVFVSGGVAFGQASGPGGRDVVQGIYEDNHVLSVLPQALPAYVAGFFGLILLGKFLGFYEMGTVSTMVLLTIIGVIVYKFYLPR